MATEEVNGVCGGCPRRPGAGHIGGECGRKWEEFTSRISVFRI